MFPVEIASIGNDNVARMEVMQACGVVVAVEPARSVERISFVDVGTNQIKPMQLPVKTQFKCCFACQDLSNGQMPSQGIRMAVVVAVILHQLEDSHINFIIAFHGNDGFLYGVGGKPIVAIDCGYPFTLGDFQSCVAGLRLTLIAGKRQHFHPCIFFRIIMQDGERIIGGAVVDGNHLDRLIGLSQQRVETLRQVVGRVIDRYQHTDQRLLTHPYFLWSLPLIFSHNLLMILVSRRRMRMEIEKETMKANEQIPHLIQPLSTKAVMMEVARRTNWMM